MRVTWYIRTRGGVFDGAWPAIRNASRTGRPVVADHVSRVRPWLAAIVDVPRECTEAKSSTGLDARNDVDLPRRGRVARPDPGASWKEHESTTATRSVTLNFSSP